MKSVKPGRAPSMMGGIMSIAMGLFGVIWTVIAAGMGGGLFVLFGVVFIAVAVVQAVYNFRNATSPNRYSAFDITEDSEEPDPLNQRFGEQHQSPADGGSTASFCPYCGTKAQSGYSFCSSCGKKLP